MPNDDSGHGEACDGGPIRRVQYAERHDLDARMESGMAGWAEERGLLLRVVVFFVVVDVVGGFGRR